MIFFDLIFNAIASGISWFVQVFTAAGLLDTLMGVAIFTLVFNRLLSPMLRGAGSDRARRSSGKDDPNE